MGYTRGSELFVYDLKQQREILVSPKGTPMASYGVAEFIAQEEMHRHRGYWWSKDDRFLVFSKVDNTPVPIVDRYEIYADELKTYKQSYPFAGAKTCEDLFSADRSAETEIAIEVAAAGLEKDVYLARVNWHPKRHDLYLQIQTRDQKKLTLFKYQVQKTHLSAVLTEEEPTGFVSIRI